MLFRVFSLLIALFHLNNFLGPNGHSIALSFTLAAFYCFCQVFYFALLLLYHECLTECILPLLLRFFTLYPFTTFGASTATTSLYQGIGGSQQFFLEGYRASHCGSKHRPGPSICLNHKMFHNQNNKKKFYLNMSKYVDKLLIVKSIKSQLKRYCGQI